MTHRSVLLIAAWLLLPAPALAYIDPGTGSYVVQVVAATVLGALYTLKVYWREIKAFLTGRRNETPPADIAPPAPPAAPGGPADPPAPPPAA